MVDPEVRFNQKGLLTTWGAHRIAASLGCVPATAVRVVRRFLALGEEGLLDGRRDNGQLKYLGTALYADW